MIFSFLYICELQVQGVQSSLLVGHRTSLFGDSRDVRPGDLVKSGHVQAETSGETGLYEESEIEVRDSARVLHGGPRERG